MIIDRTNIPRSSFLSCDKDLGIICDQIAQGERIKKLLYYNTPDAVKKPRLTDEQTSELFGKNIKIVPKLYIDRSVLTYIIVSFDNFTTNANNPEFRDNIIEFDIVCHFDQWQLEDYQLRPYRIAAELDSMFNNKHLTGIGKTEFLGANQIVLNDEFAGLCLMFRAVHGEEDKKFMPNPNDEVLFIEDFKDSSHIK